MHPGTFTAFVCKAWHRAAVAAALVAFCQLAPAQTFVGKGFTPDENGRRIEDPVQAAPTTDDRALWDAVKDSRDVNDFKAYLNKFPNGLFAELAGNRVRALAAGAAQPPLAQSAQAPLFTPPSTAQAQGMVLGPLVAAVRRTSSVQLEDESIELRVASRLRENLGERAHINITSYNGQVLLTGEVPSVQDRVLAEQLTARTENVRGTVNDLVVLGNTTMSQRASDFMITARVRAGLVDARDLFANAFKVVTERGATYLMGRVTQREANRATDIVRTTQGVQKVVRLLEIISEDELKALSFKSAP